MLRRKPKDELRRLYKPFGIKIGLKLKKVVPFKYRDRNVAPVALGKNRSLTTKQRSEKAP